MHIIWNIQTNYTVRGVTPVPVTEKWLCWMKFVKKTSFEHGVGAPPIINDQRGQGAFWSYFYFLCVEFKKKNFLKLGFGQ